MSRRSSVMFAVAVAAATSTAAFAAKPAESFHPGFIQSIAGPGGTPTAESVHNFAPFSVNVFNPATAGFDPTNVALGNVPAGSYNHWTATVNWNSSVNDAWSSEAFMALSDTPANNALTGVWYASGPPTAGQAGNSNNTTLTWNRRMNFPYAGGTPMNFWGIQQFGGSGAQWDNVTITFDEVPNPPSPVSTQAFQNGQTSGPLAPTEVIWHKFNWDGAAPLVIDTIGSTLTHPTNTDLNDTELGLYSLTGALILLNDDINGAADRRSRITLDPAIMPAGEYWLAAGGFNTTYLADFVVTSTSGFSGDLVINGISIPEPASLGLIGLAGLGLLARRRKA